MPKNRPESANEGGAAKKAKQTVLSWEEQSPDERKSSLQTISAKLKELDLKHIKVNAETSLLAQADATGSLLEHYTLRIEGIYPSSQSAQIEEFKTFLKTVAPDAQLSYFPAKCVGETAPNTHAFSLENAEVPITFGGQVTLLVFWSSPEIPEIRNVRKIAEEHKVSFKFEEKEIEL